MKKPTTKKIIKMITEIRADNNVLWMSLLELAVTEKPTEAKAIMRKITSNDRAVLKWLSKF